MKCGTQCVHLTINVHVVEESVPSLLGKDWLKQVKLDRRSVGLSSIDKRKSKVVELLSKYSGMFEEGPSVMSTFKAKLDLKPECKPKFYKASNIPFALKPAVEAGLFYLLKEGIPSRSSTVSKRHQWPQHQKVMEILGYAKVMKYW